MAFATHTVTNQAPPLEPSNLYAGDTALREAVARFDGAWGDSDCQTYGALAGDELMAAGFAANEHPPRLKTHDRYGHRIDAVEFHPAYHRLMDAAISHGIPSRPWADPKPGAQVVRAAMSYLHTQAEAGTGCPLTMTYAAVPALRHDPDIAAQWVPKITSRVYDPRRVPWTEKAGVTIGMGMTEKQGGSDVRSNTTTAEADGEGVRLVGHKWFFSAPMCDAFLVLAQGEGGLSCYLMPRFAPDGQANAFRIQRLKDKLGDRANASSEVEFFGTWAQPLGAPGRGVQTIMDMVMHTRLDCMIGSSGLMRQALAQALHHCRHRQAFGKTLIDQPLMQNVLADLAVESEAALLLTLRLARALDSVQAGDATQAALARLLTAVGKYWVCKRTPMMINEAQECLGGAGFVEESILPRLYRQAPLNSIWEGSGNIQCLDVLRAAKREPDAVAAVVAELDAARGADARLDAAIDTAKAGFADTEDLEFRARRVVENLAVALQGALLVGGSDAAVSDAYCASRLAGDHGRVFGTLPRGVDAAGIVRRAMPAA